MSCDPNFSTTSLLLHCNGANNSTTFTDETGKTVTAVGNAKISTAQSMFGGSSGLCDGSGDYLTVPSNAGFQFGAGDFTVELFVRFSAVPGAGAFAGLVTCRDTAATNNGWNLWYGGTEKFYFSYSLNGTTQVASATLNSLTPAANQWYHVALVRSGANVDIYVDGVNGTTHNIGTGALFASTALIRIGAANTTPTFFLNGHFAEVRVTKGAARYTADFTTPSAAFPDHQCTLSGVVGTPGAYQERTIRAYREDTGALVGSATSSSVDGTYSVPVTHTGECIVTATHPTNHPLIHSRAIPV